MEQKKNPVSLIFSAEEPGIVLRLYLPENASEADAVELATICLLVIGKNHELMEICIEQASLLKQHSELIVKALSVARKRNPSKPAVSPLDALNF